MFVITSSYTANLSSLLTVQKLRSARDIEWLIQNKLPVGCDNSSTFVKNYLVQVYHFPSQQVLDVDNEQDIMEKFKSKQISALFIESPYEKVFLNKYCKDYTATTAAYKFGGMGFVSAYNFFFGMFTFTKCFAFLLISNFFVLSLLCKNNLWKIRKMIFVQLNLDNFGDYFLSS